MNGFARKVLIVEEENMSPKLEDILRFVK